MKSIFKINPVTYFLLLSILLCGYFNYFVVIFVILFFHEIGHMMMIKLFNEKIKKIEILPFGAIIKMDMQANISSIKLFLISSFILLNSFSNSSRYFFINLLKTLNFIFTPLSFKKHLNKHFLLHYNN